MTLQLLCMGLIGLIFGLAVIFFGYRLFLVLLPLWGFVFGFGLGAQTLQAIFGQGMFSTVTSWVVGFVVGAIFAVLSYLFYIVAVAILSGSFGYGLAVGLLGAIGLDLSFLVWLIGIVVGVIVAVVVLRFNIQKYAVIVITSAGGAGAVIFSILGALGQIGPLEQAIGNPVRAAIQNSFLWLIFFLVMAVAGIVVQIRANKDWEIETYNRWTEA